ncbi:DNA-3-methyladenine glycosylase 1-like [Ostrinia nubilalis]|uniref:DNA-3-methyladenine glycosylase 1-like n=1 Tax=Ostrinia nubilalis TaxID=29057 RepID=UPI00308258F0
MQQVRCGWVTNDPVYIQYHDEEWGKPEFDTEKLFEMLCLEGQQAGLSWLTILKKRNSYREIFQGFTPSKVANFTDEDVKRILIDARIIRHKGKIEAIIQNAKAYLEMEKKDENFSEFIWDFVSNKPIINNWSDIKEIPTKTAESIALLSTALKSRGFKFVGPTICYAFMQACGLINDHTLNCFVTKKNRDN